MVPSFATSFVSFIGSELEQTSNGLASPHHVHNVQSAIANILSLLQYDNEIERTAERLVQMAADYINRHAFGSVSASEQERTADMARFHAAQDALAVFCTALARAKPSSRARTLGLA